MDAKLISCIQLTATKFTPKNPFVMPPSLGFPHHFSADRPLSDPEDDKLNRNNFSATLANSLANWKERDRKREAKEIFLIQESKLNDFINLILQRIRERAKDCHAVSVKGQSFPPPKFLIKNCKPRIHYLSASSLAFANCFEIEHRLKHRAADWYIDSRIVRKIDSRRADYPPDPVVLLPGKTSRKVHVYHNSFR